MSTETTEKQLVSECTKYLRSQYGETLVRYNIEVNEVEDGEGELTMECTVRAGGDDSRWRKTFTFEDGRVVDMAWQYLG